MPSWSAGRAPQRRRARRFRPRTFRPRALRFPAISDTVSSRNVAAPFAEVRRAGVLRMGKVVRLNRSRKTREVRPALQKPPRNEVEDAVRTLIRWAGDD